MKKRNQYRVTGEEKVKSLVSGLSYIQRAHAFLISCCQWSFARRFALVLCLIAGVCYGGLRLYDLAFEQTQQLRIEHIEFSSHGILDQASVLQILGIKGTLHVTHLDTQALTKKLQDNPLIDKAHVYTELPSTLHINVSEYLPITYVRKKNDLKGPVFFMEPKGTLFPVDARYHQEFLNSPIWYVEADDYLTFAEGSKIKEQSYDAIVGLLTAVNAYELAEIPRIQDLYRPKPWKIVFNLESGCQVMMKSFDLDQQVKRLFDIVEYARATNRQLRSVNVIPEKNPALIFF